MSHPRRHVRARPVLALAAAMVLSGARLLAQPIADQSSCEVCHADERVAYEDSAHAKTGMTCVDCHGGDPKDMHETAMAPRTGFRPAPTREEIPQVCASCHADRERMRPYGLPTSQFEDYQTSMHGQRHNQGDMTAAICVDCHASGREKGMHDILPVSDTRASVHPRNVPGTCGRCHADSAKMKSYGIPTDQLDLYKGSVHGQALLVGGNDAAANCVSCHGSHGALPPGIAHIDEVCGRCHQREHDLVKGSVHGGLSGGGDGQFRACLSCHGEEDGGGHGITPPSHEMLSLTCVKCHTEDSALAQGTEVQALLAVAQQALEGARAQAERGKALGFHVAAWDDVIKNALTETVQSRIAQHSLLPHDVDEHSQAVESDRDTLKDEVDRRLKIVTVRRAALVPVWIFVAWTISMLYWKRHRAMRLLHDAPTGHGEAVEG